MSFQKVCVIGAGAWGTGLAQAAAHAGRDVTLIARHQAQVDEINTARRNRAYLDDIALSERITAQCGAAGLADADFVMLALPAQASRSVLEDVGPLLAGKPVVLTAKGFETGTLKRQSEILAELAVGAEALVLSGPSFAIDVGAGRPTAVTLAGAEDALTESIAMALASARFRPYASHDVIGVELAGGLKNVYALGCGAVEGANLGLSARSSFLARAFAELSRLVVRLGGESATLTGLAGLGDLTLSCTSTQSRNYKSGVLLGQGKSLEAVKASGVGLAEGILTAPVALEIAQMAGVDVPLIAAVNQLLSGRVHIEEIVAGLMTRPLKREGDGA